VRIIFWGAKTFLIAVAEPLIVTLLTDKWLPSVIFLRILPMVGICYFLSGTCLTILRSLGFSGATFAIALVKNAVALVALVISYRFGLTALVIGQVCASLFNLCLNLWVVQIKSGYRVTSHLSDLAPGFVASVVAAAITWIVVELTPVPPFFQLLVGMLTMALVYIGVCRIWKVAGYLRAEEIILRRLASISLFSRGSTS